MELLLQVGDEWIRRQRSAGCAAAQFCWIKASAVAMHLVAQPREQWREVAPRMLIVEIQHANPYYDDSYAVNSATLGPYGDAITHELIPYIEEKFRGIGQGWSRFLYGGSTGGWEALGVQVILVAQFFKGELKGDAAGTDRTVEILKQHAPRAEKEGVIFGLENYLSAEENLAILDRVGSPAVQVYYDVGN